MFFRSYQQPFKAGKKQLQISPNIIENSSPIVAKFINQIQSCEQYEVVFYELERSWIVG